MFKPNDRVVTAENQLHGNSAVLSSAEVVSVHGNNATVIFDGEDIPREISVDKLCAEESMFGNMSGRPNELPVIDAIRR